MKVTRQYLVTVEVDDDDAPEDILIELLSDAIEEFSKALPSAECTTQPYS